MAFSALQRFGLKSPETQAGGPVGGGAPRLSRRPAGLAHVGQPQACSSFSQAES